MHVLQGAGTVPRAGGTQYAEHLRVSDLSLGTYFIPAGGADQQQPHTEDEVYVVVRGRARLWTPTAAVAVEAGTVVFMPAGEEHLFVDVVEDLTVLVVFAPAEHSMR